MVLVNKSYLSFCSLYISSYFILLFSGAVFCHPSLMSRKKDLSVILMLSMKCRQCMFLACCVKIPWVTPWLCSLPAQGTRWLSWEYRQEWKVLFSWAKETMLAHAWPPQWGIPWCDNELWKNYAGGTSLQVKSCLGAVRTGMGLLSELPGHWVLDDTRWDIHPLLFISAVSSASE